MVFNVVVSSMIDRQRRQLLRDSDRGDDLKPPKNSYQQEGQSDIVALNPTEWSISIWSFATAQIYQEDLLVFVAELLQSKPAFIDSFKTQEISNCCWGVATMLSNRFNKNMEGSTAAAIDLQVKEESVRNIGEEAALSILRVVTEGALIDRAGEFRTQELR